MKNKMLFNRVVRSASKTIGIPTVVGGGGDYNGEMGMNRADSMITTATTIINIVM